METYHRAPAGCKPGRAAASPERSAGRLSPALPDYESWLMLSCAERLRDGNAARLHRLLCCHRGVLAGLGVGVYPLNRLYFGLPAPNIPGLPPPSGSHATAPLRGADGKVVGVYLENLARPWDGVALGGPGFVRDEATWPHPDTWPGDDLPPLFVTPLLRDAAALRSVGLWAVALPAAVSSPHPLIECLRGLAATMSKNAALAGKTPSPLRLCVVGPVAWARDPYYELETALPNAFLLHSAPPEGRSTSAAWFARRLEGKAAGETLDDLGCEFVCALKRRTSADPSPRQATAGAGEDGPDELPEGGPGAEAMSRPFYGEYLSASARDRGANKEERLAAVAACEAARRGDYDEAARLVAEGELLSAREDARQEAEERLADLLMAQEEDATQTSRPPTPAPVPPEAQRLDDILKLLDIDPLGHHGDNSVEIFSLHRRRVARIPNVSQFSYPTAVQVIGDQALRLICDAADRPPPGKLLMSDVRTAIAYRAGQVRLDAAPPLGQGCWATEGGVALVNGPEAALWRGRRLHRLATPRLGGHVLDLGAADPWVDLAALEGHLEQAAHAAWSADVLEEAARLFANWFWKHPADHRVAAALVACSWVQTLWPWRPLVAVAGPSDSGKSSLFRLLIALFGPLALYSQKSTEAAVRQLIGHSAGILLLDEFEADLHRQRVLEMLRVTSQGGAVHRGTSDQRGKAFRVQHLPWTAAIESGLNKTADRNRFIRLDLEAPPAGRRGKLALPAERQLRDLGVRLLAVALRNLPTAVALFTMLKGQQVQGVAGRMVENYSVPAALWAAATGRDPLDAADLLREFLDGRAAATAAAIVADEEALLNAVLESQIEMVEGRHSVAEVIGDQDRYEAGRDEVERNGVARVTKEATKGRRPKDLAQLPMVFICSEVAKRYLLRGTDWALKDIDQILLRLPGAARGERRLAGKVRAGVLLPVASLKLAPEADEELPELPEGEVRRAGAQGASDGGRPAQMILPYRRAW